MRTVLIFILLLLIFSSFGQPEAFKKRLILMGTGFEITVVMNEETEANRQINLAVGEIQRIENLISSWKESSQTSMINKSAGIAPVTVSYELYKLIERAQKVSELTGGAFDLSFASIDHIWQFDGSMKSLPSGDEIRNSVARINYKDIILNDADTSVFLRQKGMKIGFGAMGKGYAANRVKELMITNGVESGVINASGDLYAWGQAADGSPWKIGIADPSGHSGSKAWFTVSDMAVVTSGNYEKFAEIEGVRYSHIIDPRTGWPARGLKSVTVICADAELADALATAIFVMGKDVGIDLIDQLKGIECLVIDEEGKLTTSKNLELSYEYRDGVDYIIE